MTNETKFDAAKYLTKWKGKDYLEVKWRLLWLRTEHPNASITTDCHTFTSDLALFKATVCIPDGGYSTGWGSETKKDFLDYSEKAETKAIGRALAALGFGTQFCADFDSPQSNAPLNSPQANTPVTPPTPKPAPAPAPTPTPTTTPSKPTPVTNHQPAPKPTTAPNGLDTTTGEIPKTTDDLAYESARNTQWTIVESILDQDKSPRDEFRSWFHRTYHCDYDLARLDQLVDCARRLKQLRKLRAARAAAEARAAKDAATQGVPT